MEEMFGPLMIICLACGFWLLDRTRKPRLGAAGFTLLVAVAHAASALLMAVVYIVGAPFAFWLVCGDSTMQWQERCSPWWFCFLFAPMIGSLLAPALRKNKKGQETEAKQEKGP